MKALFRALVLVSVSLALIACNKPNADEAAAGAAAIKNLETAAANKQVILNWATELNKSNLAYLQEVIHPDFVDHNPFPGVPANKEGYIATLTKAHQEWFPGIQVEVVDVLAGDDKVAFRVNVKAKHVGNVMGAPGTGKDLAWEAYGIYRVQDGKLIERWELLDSFSFMSQLGMAKMAN